MEEYKFVVTLRNVALAICDSMGHAIASVAMTDPQARAWKQGPCCAEFTGGYTVVAVRPSATPTPLFRQEVAHDTL